MYVDEFTKLNDAKIYRLYSRGVHGRAIIPFVNINNGVMGPLFLQNKDIPQTRFNLVCGINIFCGIYLLAEASRPCSSSSIIPPIIPPCPPIVLPRPAIVRRLSRLSSCTHITFGAAYNDKVNHAFVLPRTRANRNDWLPRRQVEFMQYS